MASSRVLLILVALLGTAPYESMAGNRVGNGGDIVTCDKKATILDFFEVWRFRDPMAGESPTGGHKELLGKIFDRLNKVAPDLAGQYRRRSLTIFDEIEFSEDVKPVELKDSLHAFEPAAENCKILQLAIRIGVPPKGSKRFLVHKKRFDQLSPSAQAGLILHEIVYEHLGRLGETDSRRVRKFIAHLFSPEFANETKGGFWLFVKDLKIPIYP